MTRGYRQRVSGIIRSMCSWDLREVIGKLRRKRRLRFAEAEGGRKLGRLSER